MEQSNEQVDSIVQPHSWQQISKIPLELVRVDDQFNCRGHITPLDVSDLVQDFQQHGQIQPIIVRPIPQSLREGKEEYLVVAGNRRTVAARFLRWATVNAIIREDLTDTDIYVFNLSENVKRQELTIIQEARGIAHLIDLGHGRKKIASRIGMSEGWVQTRIMVNELCREPLIEKEFDDNNITRSTDVKELYNLLSKGKRDEVFEAIKGIKERKFRDKQKAEKTTVTPADRKVAKANERRRRTEPEVQRAIGILLKTFGECLTTRFLGWVNGYVSSHEALELMKEMADKKGVPFVPPEDNLI